MRSLLPWRARNGVSDRFPLACHPVASAGFSASDAIHLDARLAKTWDACPLRILPTHLFEIVSIESIRAAPFATPARYAHSGKASA